MALVTRRRLLSALGLGGLALIGARLGLPRYWRVGPPRALEGRALEFAQACLEGLDRGRIWDAHSHLVGLGRGTECSIHPDWQSHLHPVLRLQYELYLGAAGIADGPSADADYLERLLTLQRAANPAGKLVLFAFDLRCGEDGAEQPDLSAFYTPNEYVLEVARAHPDQVVACASIHPYRLDAVERLERAVAAGARAVKWLPSAMGIDPASELCDGLYARLAELGLPLITHAGEEQSMEVHGSQDLGNPLRLRRALEAGVRVVVAHCASLGSGPDLDVAGAGRPELECFDLFLRLMGEPRYAGLLFADVSALTFTNRCGRPLAEMLRARHLHPRLIYGSDYPLPALEPLNSTWLLERRGYILAEERRLLNEICEANPLLFDLCLKRCVRARDAREDPGVGFDDIVFQSDRLFLPA